MKNKKLLWYLGGAAIILIIFAVIGKSAGWLGNTERIKVSTEKPANRTITEIITANGKIQPETEVKISPDVSGEIVELNVKEGDEVKAGQLLIKINPDIYLSNLDRMVATVNSSKANLANAQAHLLQVEAQMKQAELSYNRNKTLHDKGAISDADFENSQSAFETAKAELAATKENINSMNYGVKSAEASLKEANENLMKTTIYAPVNGTISKLNVEKGERVVGTAQMPGTELLRIANLNLMEVKVEVNENDIVHVKLGDTALIEVDAYLSKKFRGIVTEIANSANTTGVAADQVTSFDVKILLLQDSYKYLIPKDNPNYYPFRPGMSASVDIQTETLVDVLSVPIQAVTTRTDSTKLIMNNKKEDQSDKGGSPFDEKTDKAEKAKTDSVKEIVFILKDGKATIRQVKTGIQDNNYIRIISGLTEKDEVITAPYTAVSKKLKEGTKVEKVAKDKLFEQK
ncbi:MAG: efflux RND transporter periplasmic adaptor subunit [Bacteroidia bacterium]|nr:efflux RND transporter periplasmic adaptor subunit [Bacteroidia bacterium]